MTLLRKIMTQAIFWILMLITSLFYAPLIAAEYQHPIPIFFCLSLFFLVLLPLLAGALQYICYRKKWDRNYFVRIPILVIAIVLYLPNLQDEELIETGWSLDEFTSNDPEALKSYDLLETFMSSSINERAKLIDKHGIINRCRKETLDYSSEQNQKNIELTWQENGNLLRKFSNLNNFDKIISYRKNLPLVEKPSLQLALLRNITFLYIDYANVKSAQGKVDESIRLLEEIYVITRKIAPSTLTLIDRMICVAVFDIVLAETSNFINRYDFSEKQIKLLAEIFTPLDDELSMKQFFKGEYLVNEELLSLKYSNMLQQAYLFKKNRTLNNIKKYFMMVIEESSVAPFSTTKSEQYWKDYTENVDPTNPVGWMLSQIALPSLAHNQSCIIKLKIKSQLFYLLLADKCGQNPSVLDPFTGEMYKKDKQGNYRSAGPDQKYFTDDDILLTNPKTKTKRGK